MQTPTNQAMTNHQNAANRPWRVPYGVANFVNLHEGHEYYVDKTHFLPLLE